MKGANFIFLIRNQNLYIYFFIESELTNYYGFQDYQKMAVGNLRKF